MKDLCSKTRVWLKRFKQLQRKRKDTAHHSFQTPRGAVAREASLDTCVNSLKCCYFGSALFLDKRHRHTILTTCPITTGSFIFKDVQVFHGFNRARTGLFWSRRSTGPCSVPAPSESYPVKRQFLRNYFSWWSVTNIYTILSLYLGQSFILSPCWELEHLRSRSLSLPDTEASRWKSVRSVERIHGRESTRRRDFTYS